MSARSVYRGPWRIDLEVRAGVGLPVARSVLALTAATALDAAGAAGPASIGLVLSDDAELEALNQAHMGQTGPTDVLSFPLLPPDAYPPHPGGAAVTSRVRPPGPSFATPPGRRPHLGDIVVSVERAVEQAAAGLGGHEGTTRWSAGEELRLLVTHGTLHVCGWDHADPVEGEAMRALERQLLGLRDVPRGLDRRPAS